MKLADQIRQIQLKLRERTIGTPLPATHVNTPVWTEPPKRDMGSFAIVEVLQNDGSRK